MDFDNIYYFLKKEYKKNGALSYSTICKKVKYKFNLTDDEVKSIIDEFKNKGLIFIIGNGFHIRRRGNK